MSLGGDWLCVEFPDNVDVGIVNRGNRGGGRCSGRSLLRVGWYGCGQVVVL